MDSLNIHLEFSGGAELLMKDKSKYRTIHLPIDQSKKWTLHSLSQWIRDNLLAERSELFYMNDNVRPGILVLVNDTDWELLGEREYEIKSAAEECALLLKAAGFKELKETEQWALKPLDKCYMTKNKSTIIAFAIGGRFRPGNGMSIVAAHTDSPCLRVKPVSKISSADCLQVGVSTYGGGLWRTWFDRDLTVAGRVIVKENQKSAQSLLLHIKRPIMSIPNLAIHLDRESNDKFCFNKEDHLRPVLAMQVAKALKGGDNDKEPQDHHPVFLDKIAEELEIDAKNILDFDLSVIDTQPAVIGGINEEFIYGPRLDNLVNTFSSIMGLIQSCSIDKSLANDSYLRIAACYDNEECGSESAQGAASALTEWVLRRLQSPLTYGYTEWNFDCCFEKAIANSLMISADQAHALHPNYKSKHEENHGPRFHKGVVVKINVNQRYATTTLTHSILQTVAKEADVPLQKFVVRNDMACGSTVGPILSAKLGLKTVDVGAPQLAMHSIREMSCISGPYHSKQLFSKFFEKYAQISALFDEAV